MTTATLLDSCRPITDRLAENSRGYFQRYRGWIMVLCVAAVADLITTMRFMHAEGVEMEVHPAIRIVAHLTGPFVGPAIGKLAQLAAIGLVTLYARRIAVYVFIATIMMYSWAAWYNVWGRELYSPLLIEWLGL